FRESSPLSLHTPVRELAFEIAAVVRPADCVQTDVSRPVVNAVRVHVAGGRRLRLTRASRSGEDAFLSAGAVAILAAAPIGSLVAAVVNCFEAARKRRGEDQPCHAGEGLHGWLSSPQ